jgi:hypothetical protein
LTATALNNDGYGRKKRPAEARKCQQFTTL